MNETRKKILTLLKEHGPLTMEAMRKHGLPGSHTAQQFHRNGLQEDKEIVVVAGKGRGQVYGLPGQKAPAKTEQPEPALRVKKGKKAQKKAKAAPKAARRAPRADPPAERTNGAPQFAINEDGELGIEHEGQKMRLDADAFTRLRSFIEKTEPVWSA